MNIDASTTAEVDELGVRDLCVSQVDAASIDSVDEVCRHNADLFHNELVGYVNGVHRIAALQHDDAVAHIKRTH